MCASATELTVERVQYELGQRTRFTDHEERCLGGQCCWQCPTMAGTHEVAEAVHLLGDRPRSTQDLPNLVGTSLAGDDVLRSDTEPLAGEVPELTEVGALGHGERQLLQANLATASSRSFALPMSWAGSSVERRSRSICSSSAPRLPVRRSIAPSVSSVPSSEME